MEIALVTALVCVAILLLATEWIPVDLTALGIPVVLMVSGILEPGDALAGFSNPAPLTVGALLIVSRGLLRTGALDFLSRKLIRVTRGRSGLLMFLVLGLTGVFSAFLNNTPVVLLFVSILMVVCCEHALPPSRFLIPLSFLSILAGTSTLIGTSTNIIVSDLGAEMGCAPIGMFELASVGVPLTIVGGLFLGFVAYRWLPGHKLPVCEMSPSDRRKYLSELTVTDSSAWTGKPIQAELAEQFPDMELFEIFRGDQVHDPESGPIAVRENDILLVKATADDLVAVVNRNLARLPKGEGGKLARPTDQDALLVELIVPPGSALVGMRLADSDLIQEKGSHLLGVQRRRVHHSGSQLDSLRLGVGDILLAQCSAERIEVLKARGDLMVLDDMSVRILNKRQAPVALALFVGMVLAAATGLTSILVASLTAAFLMILTGCLRLRTAYQAVDVRVLLLIIGTLALGKALQVTGAAEFYALGLMGLFHQQDPLVFLGAIVVSTSLLSHFLSNNATAVLMVPVALSTAAALGVEPRPFLVAVCFGASACFASPFGYQTNLLVYSPGGYRFIDYVKTGLPLNLLVWVGAIVLIPRFWPL